LIALRAALSLVIGYRILLTAMAVVTTGCAAWLAWRFLAGEGMVRRDNAPTCG
jgi:hypothetical protein